MPDLPTVHQALAKVMEELPAIAKGDKSPQGYTYRGIEAITKQLAPILASNGVVIVPNATITNVLASPGMKESWQDIYMSVEWTIVGPDGSQLYAKTTGIGRDNADKGANKAQTQAYKYLLLHLLCISDAADDTDGATYDDHRDDHRDNDDRPRAAAAGPTPEQQVATVFAGLSAHEKKAVNDYAKTIGVKNVMRSGEHALALLGFIEGAPAPTAEPEPEPAEEPF